MRDIIFIRENVRRLIQQLYPTGRAWQGKDDSLRERDVKADSISDYIYELETFIATILPDNDMFNNNDATNWERRIGLDYDPETLTLDERKAEIIRKLSFPGGFKHTLTLDFLEYQLRASSFDIHVYPNLGLTQPAYTELVANSVDKEDGFTINNFHHSFIIAGETINTQAIIESRRRNEFIRKILKYKPMNMVCILNSTVSKQDGTFQLKYSDYVCELIQETPPYATNVTITGINIESNLEVGNTLIGSYTYNDDEGDAQNGTTSQWYRADDNAGLNAIPIPGATSQTYTLTVDDTDKNVAFSVTPKNVKATGVKVVSDYTEAITNAILPVIINFEEGNVNTLTWTMGDSSQSSGTWEAQYRSSTSNPWTVSTAGGSPRVGLVYPNIFQKVMYFRVRRISTPTTEFSDVYSEYVTQVHNHSQDKTSPVNISDASNGITPPPAFDITGNQYTASNIYLSTKFTIPAEDDQLYFEASDGIVRPATKNNLLAYSSNGPTGDTVQGIKWIRFASYDNSTWEVNPYTGKLISQNTGGGSI